MRVHSSVPRRMVVSLLVIAAGGACRSDEPRTDAQGLARGREIVQRMSDKLGSTSAFTVTTKEVRDELRPGGKTERVTLTRETTIRRPDRLYSKVSGDRQNEVWYDGVGITLVMHGEKVFGQARVPETLDKALDAIYERYGVAAPFADYVYSDSAKALLVDSTIGGWVARETLDDQPADHLAFKDKGVNWEVWISAGGDPLPLKAIAEFTENPRLRKTEMTFAGWNLSPQIDATRFEPVVPPDYEGIAILQRARILRSMPKDGTEAASQK
jgi:hypothetical protein